MNKIKVERLVRPLEWVRKTKIGELKVANVPFEKEHCVRNVISKYNTGHGRRTGKFVHVAYNQEAERLGIYVVSREERENELNGNKYAQNWKNKFPKSFFERDKSEIGTEYD